MLLAKVHRGDELERFGPRHVYTPTGRLRLRWWLFIAIAIYAGYNLVVVGMVARGSSMALERGWHEIAIFICWAFNASS